MVKYLYPKLFLLYRKENSKYSEKPSDLKLTDMSKLGPAP